MADILAVPGIMRVSDWFRWRLVKRAAELNLSADCIAAVISHESGFRANIKNQLGYKYGGLIGYGGKGYKDAITKSAEWQLDNQILPLYNSFSYLKGNDDCGAYLMSTFLPAMATASDDTIIGEKDNFADKPCPQCPSKGSLYKANYGFDRDKDGVFTVADVKQSVRNIAAGAATKPRIPVSDDEPPKPRGNASIGKAAGVFVLAALGIWGIGKVLR